jgi:hypothetical protein
MECVLCLSCLTGMIYPGQCLCIYCCYMWALADSKACIHDTNKPKPDIKEMGPHMPDIPDAMDSL